VRLHCHLAFFELTHACQRRQVYFFFPWQDPHDLAKTRTTSLRMIDLATCPLALRSVLVKPVFRDVATDALRALERIDAPGWSFERAELAICVVAGRFEVRVTDYAGCVHAFLADDYTLRPWLASASDSL
jgi:hypothetical protein